MSVEDTFGNFFKPELKSSGRKLVNAEKVSLTTQSDSQVQAFIKLAPPFRVTLSSDNISSHSFVAACSCPAAQKSRFCKHIWATLLYIEEHFPDFLSQKREIELQSLSPTTETSKNAAYQETAKKKAADYRKEQYQRQKLYAKTKKRERFGLSTQSTQSYSVEVETALAYFSTNGFPMPAGPSAEILSEAKRKLSRIFHPDKGGSHEESVELNRHCEAILKFF